MLVLRVERERHTAGQRGLRVMAVSSAERIQSRGSCDLEARIDNLQLVQIRALLERMLLNRLTSHDPYSDPPSSLLLLGLDGLDNSTVDLLVPAPPAAHVPHRRSDDDRIDRRVLLQCFSDHVRIGRIALYDRAVRIGRQGRGELGRRAEKGVGPVSFVEGCAESCRADLACGLVRTRRIGGTLTTGADNEDCGHADIC